MRTGIARAVTLAAAAVVIAAPQALAHSGIKSATPSAGSSVRALPAFLRITFGEPLGRVSSVRLIDARGRDHVVTAGLDPRNAARVLARTTAPAAGAYRVTWKVVAGDGHSLAGTYAFRVVK